MNSAGTTKASCHGNFADKQNGASTCSKALVQCLVVGGMSSMYIKKEYRRQEDGTGEELHVSRSRHGGMMTSLLYLFGLIIRSLTLFQPI
jgi:hypothetical protein